MKKTENKKGYSFSNSHINKFSRDQALSKIYRYCAYQERSHKEVKAKLLTYGLRYTEADEIVSKLITDGFLNEERFAKAFAGGKFRILKWGKLKIQRELEGRGLTPRCIAKGLAEIDRQEYAKTLHLLLSKQQKTVHEPNLFKKKSKIARYAIGKGYEPELVWEEIQHLFE
ncbi:MAG: RecX family transcriptional regulator [Bacteroidetes bacterium]|nr:RecX family transcriptional regulator [Bacteroidota bacterium]MBS1540086.1 RecX family transcriptional regulator [Bacteroidota bacterium]